MSTNRYNAENLDQIGQGNIDLSTDTVRLVLVDSTYTFSAAHIALDDIPAGARVATQTLDNVAVSGGIATCDDETFAGLAGDPVVSAVSYVDSGTEATSYLLGEHTDVDHTPDGNDLIVRVPNGIISLKHGSPAADELFFDEGLDALLTGAVSLLDGNWKLDPIGVDATLYTFNATHSYTDLTNNHGTVEDVTNATLVDGVFDFDDPTFAGVDMSGDDLTHLVLCHDNGAGTIDLILCLIPLPNSVAPEGQDVSVTLGTHACRI